MTMDDLATMIILVSIVDPRDYTDPLTRSVIEKAKAMVALKDIWINYP